MSCYAVVSYYAGQFWNIPIDVFPYSGPYKDPAEEGLRYVIQVSHPDSAEPRVFTGLFHDLTWEYEEGPCFYAGNRQGGTIMEIDDPNDPVIEGSYLDYRVATAFETDFKYSHFDKSRCINDSPAK